MNMMMVVVITRMMVIIVLIISAAKIPILIMIIKRCYCVSDWDHDDTDGKCCNAGNSMMATMMIKNNAHNLSNSLRSMEATTADADDDDDHCIFM